MIDCGYKDNEQCSLINGTCFITESEALFKCTTKNMCISSKLIENGKCDCGFDEYDLSVIEISSLDYIRKQISFPTICESFTELAPVIVNRANEIDETEYEYWQRNNIYAHCDGF
ncbi:unnamed protein product [Rotaria sp. Silwood1]|nr:unnamed protein product [Rotaria sp. Silwood1]CAF1655277.1 unnamed protein product [Rotaria sp. Silwood1]